MKYNIKIHILDHAHYVSGILAETSKKLTHFNTSVCASYFIRNDVTTQKEIDIVMVKILKSILEKELKVKEKNGTYTKKNGTQVQKYRTRTIKFKNMLTAYHNRHFNSSKSVMPHFHFLFDGSARVGKDFIYLKQALAYEAIKHKIKFNFMEKKQITSLSKKQLYRIENMSWLLNQGNSKKIKNYLMNVDKLKKTLDLLIIHYQNTQNISYFLKVLSILNQRLQELNIDFIYQKINLKESILFFLNNRQKEMITDLKNNKFVQLNLDYVFERELLKHSYGFPSDAIDIIRKKFGMKKIHSKQLIFTTAIQVKEMPKKSNNDFRSLVIRDVRNALAYANNEKSWKEILLLMGYPKISIKTKKNSNGKREKIGLTITTKKKTKLFIPFSDMSLSFSKIMLIMMHNKKINRVKNVYDSQITDYKVKKIIQYESLHIYEYRVKILLQIYPKIKNKRLAKDTDIHKHLAKKYDVEISDMYGITTFKTKTTVIVDDTNKIILKKTLVKNIGSSISDMLDIAEIRGWDLKTLIVTGGKNFKEEAQIQIVNRCQITSETISLEGGLKL